MRLCFVEISKDTIHLPLPPPEHPSHQQLRDPMMIMLIMWPAALMPMGMQRAVQMMMKYMLISRMGLLLNCS